MDKKPPKISLSEKILSIFSLFTVGIIGIIILILSTFTKKKVSDFLKYNFILSIIIGVFLYLIKHIVDYLIIVCSKIEYLNIMESLLNKLFIVKTIRVYSLGISFTYFEISLFILFLYLSILIIRGKKI